MATTYITQLDEIINLSETDQKAARKALRKAVPSLPDTAAMQTALGLTYISLEQPRDAVRAFKHAIELDPGDPTPHYQLGSLQSNMGLLPHAEENLRFAVAAEPENAEYIAALGFAYYRSDKSELAIQTLETADEAGSEDDEVFASLGYLYYFEDRFEDSRQAFSRALELNPDYAEVYNNRGYLNILLGDLVGAQTDLNLCLEKDDTFLRARYNLAATTWLQGDQEEAMSLYEDARRRDQTDAELKQHLEDLDQVAEQRPDDESVKALSVKLAVAQKASRR